MTLIPEEDKRMGQFVIPIGDLVTHPGTVRKLMAKMLIIRADMTPDRRAINYWGICDLFEEILPGMIAPAYRITVSENTVNGETYFTATRMS